MRNTGNKQSHQRYKHWPERPNQREAKEADLPRTGALRRQDYAFRSNVSFARATWGGLTKVMLRSLMQLTEEYALSVAAGHLQLLNGRWYVTHAGLLRIAHRNRCSGIRTAIERELSDPTAGRWVFRATVYKSPGSRGFVGYGDADPSNVSPLVRGAEMRVAETRAVNRALRKAYGIGLCSVEELGWIAGSGNSGTEGRTNAPSAKPNGSNNGQPRLRDRLSLLIRQHQLDPTLVKRYAAEFCGTEALRNASRELVEDFINQLAEWAAKDREGLLCHLNSYAAPQEVKS